MAASAQELFTAAGCLSCLGPVDNAQTMRLGLLLNILETLGVTMTPQELMDESACFVCLPGVSQGDAIELALLSEISDAISGGGVGTTQVYQGAFADPNGNVTPDDPTKPALYFPDGGGTLWQFDSVSQAWT